MINPINSPTMDPTNAQLRRILQSCRTIAVVGLSADWNRPSYFAAKYMQTAGYTVVPVNPRYSEVLGQRCYPDLAAIDFPIDMVDVFRRTEDVLFVAATGGGQCPSRCPVAASRAGFGDEPLREN